jgi:hypothetical protein
MLTGCNGSGTQERKEDYEKMKMLKKQEEKEKKKGRRRKGSRDTRARP